MTVESGNFRSDYIGGGGVTSFAVGFQALEDTDLIVYVTDPSDPNNPVEQDLVTDYSVSGDLEAGTGSVDFVTAPASSYLIAILRAMPLSQSTDYEQYDDFPADSHERALDKLTMIAQEQEERLSRVPTMPPSVNAGAGLVFPTPEPDYCIVWNSTGTALVNGPTVTEVENAEGYATAAASSAIASAGSASAASSSASAAAGSASDAEDAQTAAEAARDAIPAADDILDVSDIGVSVEGVDSNILRANTNDQLAAVFGDTGQVIDAVNLAHITVTSNHIIWTPTVSGITFGYLGCPYDGTYVIHIYPTNVTSISWSAAYAWPTEYTEADTDADEIRVVVEKFNGRLSIISIQNMES